MLLSSQCRINAFSIVCSILSAILYTRTTSGALFTVVPMNALVLRGSQATLTCLSEGHQVAWSVQYLSTRACEIRSTQMHKVFSKLSDCALARRYTISNKVVVTDRGFTVSQLVIDDVRLEDAGTYTCSYQSGSNQRGYSNLAVLDAEPIGESGPEYVVSGQNVTFTCRVSYNSSSFLKMSWNDTSTGMEVKPSDDGVRLASKMLANDQHHNTLISQEASLILTVPIDTFHLRPFMCAVYATTSATESDPLSLPPQIFTWVSPAITIAYCPRNVAILSSNDPPTLGSRLTCRFDAHPPAVVRWKTEGGSGLVSGDRNDTLTVTSLAEHVYQIHCTAVNFPFGNEQPCYAMTSLDIHGNDGRQQSPSYSTQKYPTYAVVQSSVSPSSSLLEPDTAVAKKDDTASTVDNAKSEIKTGSRKLREDPQFLIRASQQKSNTGLEPSSVNNSSSGVQQGILVAILIQMTFFLLIACVVGFTLGRKYLQRRHINNRLSTDQELAMGDGVQLTGTCAVTQDDTTSTNE